MEETQEDLSLQTKESRVSKNEEIFGTIAFPKQKMEAI
jgi:hypothetical protein